MRQDSWSLGTWGRIPVSMHWTALLTFAWLYIIFWSVVPALIASVAVFILFIAHEWGHVFILRRRKIPVIEVTLAGLHGQTTYNEYAAKPGDAVAVAWGGVGAQALVLLGALAIDALVPFNRFAPAMIVWGPMSLVFTQFNIFLMIVALLPIGPFDGHDAWQVIARIRRRLARRRKAKPRVPPPEPEVTLGAAEREALDESSRKEAAALIERLSGKSDTSSGKR